MVDSIRPHSPSSEGRQLSEREAFEVMKIFVREFYERAGDDLGLLLSDVVWERDAIGREVTSDPAAWGDWQRCVRTILAQGGASS